MGPTLGHVRMLSSLSGSAQLSVSGQCRVQIRSGMVCCVLQAPALSFLGSLFAQSLGSLHGDGIDLGEGKTNLKGRHAVPTCLEIVVTWIADCLCLSACVGV